jgi:hypothetical protein
MSRIATGDARQYRWMFVFCFAVFLAVALVSRLLPRRLRPLRGAAGDQRSVIAEARAAANAVLPFVFMA